MKTKLLIFIIFCINLFSLGYLIMILFNYDPFYSDNFVLIMFFISLFLFLLTILTLLGFYIRIKIYNNEIFHAIFFPSLRQAILFSIVTVGLMILSSLKILTLWDGTMFALAILLLELYFQNKQIKHTNI